MLEWFHVLPPIIFLELQHFLDRTFLLLFVSFSALAAFPSLLTLSSEYLDLVKNIADKNIEQGNPHIISDVMMTEKKYEEMTRWSDFIISIPSLSNFYHGLELLLKGFLMLKENYILKLNQMTITA